MFTPPSTREHTPQLQAIVSCPSYDAYAVVFRYIGAFGSIRGDRIQWIAQRENLAFPSTTIPCRSYQHACEVASAFNAGQRA